MDPETAVHEPEEEGEYDVPMFDTLEELNN
jgi:hypothetical protein